MKSLLLIALSMLILSCSKDSSSNRSHSSDSSFGQPFIGSWKGKGKIFSKPSIDCSSAATKIALSSVDPNQIHILNTEIKCGEQTYHFADRTLSVDYKSESTFEKGVKVGNAQGYMSDHLARWFTFRIDLPEFGIGPYFMTLNVWFPGSLVDVQGPMLDLNIGTEEDGSYTGFISHLYQQSQDTLKPMCLNSGEHCDSTDHYEICCSTGRYCNPSSICP